MIFPVRPGPRPRGVALLPCSGLHFCCPELPYPGGRCSIPAGGPRLYPLFRLAKTAHIDKGVGDYPESQPPFHAFLSPIPAAVEAVPPFEHADPALAACPPFLPLAEPAFLLVPPA